MQQRRSKLLDKCNGCQKNVSWNRNKISVCRCGFDWRGYVPSPVGDLELIVTQQVHWLCNLHYGNDDSTCPLPADSPLKELSLSDFTSALIFVASQYAAIIDTKGKHLFPRRANDEIHELLSKALLTFTDWPAGFFSFIDFRCSQKQPGGPTREQEEPKGISQPRCQQAPITWKDLGETKPALFMQLAASQFDFMRGAYKEYMAIRRRESIIANAELNSLTSSQPATAHSTNATTARIEHPANNATYVSGNAAMEMLGINLSAAALDGLISVGKLKAAVDRHRGKRVYLIEHESVETLKADLITSFSLRDVIRLLGLTPYRIKDLVKHKVLSPLRGPTVDGSTDFRFSAKEIESLLLVLKSKVRQSTGGRDDRAITFHHAMRKLGRVGIELCTFIQAIFDNQISPCGETGQQGFPGLLFPERGICSLVCAEVRRLVGDVLSIAEFAEELDISVEAVGFLVKKGIIRTEIKDDLKPLGPLVARKELAAFNSTYLLPAKLAPELKTDCNYLTHLLMSCGIKPASGRKVDGGNIYIFERSAVEEVDLKLLLAKGKKQTANRIANADRLDAKEAAGFLGITQKDLLDLIARGILKPRKGLRQDELNKHKYIFTLRTLNRYKSRVTGFEELVSIKIAAEMLGISQGWFLTKYVYSERLQVARREGGRGVYYFRKRDVLSLEKITLEQIEKTYTSAEAAKICGVNMTCIYKWTVSGLLRPISGPTVDGAVNNRYLCEDIEDLHAKREAYKAERRKAGGTGRCWLRVQRLRPVRDVISQRVDQLIAESRQRTSGRPISGSRIYKQLVAEGFKLCSNTVYVYLNDKHKSYGKARYLEANKW